MKPTRVFDVLQKLSKTRWPAMIWGPPGAGKSSIVRDVAKAGELPVLDLRASLLDPTDLRGMPAIESGRAVWCPPSFLPKDSDPPGVLFLDEINAAPPLVQASLYQLVLDRRVGEYTLPDGWWIVAAGNRLGDRSVVFRFSSALANRFIHLDFDVDLGDWRVWALQRGIHPSITALLAIRPELLLGEPGERPAYPTPRSWEMTSDVIEQFGDIESCADLLSGIVGEGAAIELIAFARHSVREELFLQIVGDPQNAPIPTQLGELYALTSWLAFHAKDKSVRSAGARLLTRLPVEFAVILARDFINAAPSVVKESGYREFLRKHAALIHG
jgi:hypothetical protein